MIIKNYFTEMFCQDCPDGSDENEEACDSVSQSHRETNDKETISDSLVITNDEAEADHRPGVIEREMKLNPCAVWPPVCGQVCVSGTSTSLIMSIKTATI